MKLSKVTRYYSTQCITRHVNFVLLQIVLSKKYIK